MGIVNPFLKIRSATHFLIHPLSIGCFIPRKKMLLNLIIPLLGFVLPPNVINFHSFFFLLVVWFLEAFVLFRFSLPNQHLEIPC